MAHIVHPIFLAQLFLVRTADLTQCAFLLECRTGLVANETVTALSTHAIGMPETDTFISSNKDFNHITSTIVSAKLRYSASVDDGVTADSLFEAQNKDCRARAKFELQC
ncbi:uncharacterized protein LOC129314500 [Prosopis cineraria]|uniref:uncharacterized protein LOC129314500 n=1 Tax=Prosopis cineraria TaxID=364024 RepID=UPI00240F4AB8|nr:uncharacterized protein LOC129314500 [Prosopis cineraria]